MVICHLEISWNIETVQTKVYNDEFSEAKGIQHAGTGWEWEHAENRIYAGMGVQWNHCNRRTLSMAGKFRQENHGILVHTS